MRCAEPGRTVFVDGGAVGDELSLSKVLKV